MYVFFFAFIAVTAMCKQQMSLHAGTQDTELMLGRFVEYTDWKMLSATEGTRYVLVSADWCAPCQQLKAKIKDVIFPHGINVIVVDYDRNAADAVRMLGSDADGKPKGTIPRLIQYRTTADGNTEGVYWNPAKKTLDQFFNLR
jgi:thiol-disulfide isomerase/thioredoxin